MCGHVGVAGQLGKKEEDALKQLLIVDALRGTDSTGVACIPRHSEVKVAKQIGNPYELFDCGAFQRAMQGVNRCIIGHNRYATVGAGSRKNAHPFEFDTIVGAHNGTLSNKYALHDGYKFDVDSQALFNHIEEKGLRDAINIAKGAYTLVWWDKINESINFLRNKERPLWMVVSQDKRAMFWASELWMLEAILPRNQILTEEPFFLEPDMHLSIGIDNKGVIAKPVVTPMAQPGAVPAPYQPPQNQSAFQAAAQKLIADSKKDKVVDLCAVREQIKDKVELPVDYVPNPGHIALDIVSVNKDGFGARYFLCQDPAEPKAEIRLFFNNNLDFDPDLAVGGSIVAVVNPKPSILKNIKFWKVSHASVNWRDLEFADPVVEAELVDHKGNPISEGDFMKKYSSCCWCDGFVNPLGKFKLSSEGQALCQECMADPQVAVYFKE